MKKKPMRFTDTMTPTDKCLILVRWLKIILTAMLVILLILALLA